MDKTRDRNGVPLTVEAKKQRQNIRNRIIRFNNKEEAVKYKGGVCEHCKLVVHTAAFDFHHTDPAEKDVDPGILLRGSKEKLYKELDKCILLCANCHRIFHWQEANKDTDWEQQVRTAETVTFNDKTLTYSQWSELTGISYETLRTRVKIYGWDIEKALTTPAVIGSVATKTLTLGNETKSIAQWAKESGLTYSTIAGRVAKGWDAERIINTPPIPKGKVRYGKKESYKENDEESISVEGQDEDTSV